ncbi:MAG TPA: response regulator [Terracidiphilus sp.]|jgi:two-component system chemotaxis response regulator CheY
MRALIVDDSRFMRRHVRTLLEARGIDCDEAADGQQGIERLRSGEEFDLALIDWNMPVMSGLDLVKALRGEGYTQVKVMMVTTEGDSDRIVLALDAGADEYLMKPFDAEALEEKLALLGVEAV